MVSSSPPSDGPGPSRPPAVPHLRLPIRKPRTTLRRIYAVGLLLFAAPPGPAIWVAVPLLLAGMGLHLWAAGHLTRGETLTTSGPFAHLRHPYYLAYAGLESGLGLIAGCWWLLPLYLPMYLGLYGARAAREEAFLAARFPVAWAHYRERVPAWWPRCSPAIDLPAQVPAERSEVERIQAHPPPLESGFSWARVRWNREGPRLAGHLLLIGVLLLLGGTGWLHPVSPIWRGLAWAAAALLLVARNWRRRPNG